MSVADKVQKLAALAGSANEHEANAAARQACRLIREGKVSLRDTEQEAGPRAPQRRPSPWQSWAPASPPPRRRPIPTGPFARRRDMYGASCVVCGESIELGDAFSSAGGFVHGDCIPRSERP